MRHVRQEPAATFSNTLDEGTGAAAAASHDPSAALSKDRGKHPLSGAWGQFFFTYSPATGHAAAQWQAKCPYHRLSAKTDCTQSVAIAGDTQEDRDKAKLMLMNWCVQGATCTRKREHGAVRARMLDCEPLAVVTAKRDALPAPPPRRTLKTDAQLDAEELEPDTGRAQEQSGGKRQGRKRKKPAAKLAPKAQRRRMPAAAQSQRVAEPVSASRPRNAQAAGTQAAAAQTPTPSSSSSKSASASANSSESAASSELDEAAPLASLLGRRLQPQAPARGSIAPSSSSSSGSSGSASHADEEGSDSD